MFVYGKSFDEFNVGEKMTFPPITVTEAHIVTFAGLSGDYNPLHMNEEFAKKSIFKTRVAHGMLTLSLMSGPLGMLVAGTAMAFLGMTAKLTAPVRIGDTIRVEAEVVEKKPSTKYEGGTIRMKVLVKNQKDEVVAECETALLVAKKSML